MNRWHIAAILMAALLLVGGAGAVKPEKGPVDKVVFVHHKDANAKSFPTESSSSTFAFWGMKWNSQDLPVTINVYPANPDVSDLGAVTANLQKSYDAWDKVMSTRLFMFGKSTLPPGEADGKNDISFAPINENGVIAKTTVWYYMNSMEIVEADVQMNTNMRWGIDKDGEGRRYTLPDAFDIRNIATHEIGHVCGLADLYDPGAQELTMYGYGAEGEVKKISLAAGDIGGIQTLYGA